MSAEDPLFAALDRNGDGVVSRLEFDEAVRVPGSGFCCARAAGPLDERFRSTLFEALDRNGDGVIAAAELAPARSWVVPADLDRRGGAAPPVKPPPLESSVWRILYGGAGCSPSSIAQRASDLVEWEDSVRRGREMVSREEWAIAEEEALLRQRQNELVQRRAERDLQERWIESDLEVARRAQGALDLTRPEVAQRKRHIAARREDLQRFEGALHDDLDAARALLSRQPQREPQGERRVEANPECDMQRLLALQLQQTQQVLMMRQMKCLKKCLRQDSSSSDSSDSSTRRRRKNKGHGVRDVAVVHEVWDDALVNDLRAQVEALRAELRTREDRGVTMTGMFSSDSPQAAAWTIDVTDLEEPRHRLLVCESPAHIAECRMIQSQDAVANIDGALLSPLLRSPSSASPRPKSPPWTLSRSERPRHLLPGSAREGEMSSWSHGTREERGPRHEAWIVDLRGPSDLPSRPTGRGTSAEAARRRMQRSQASAKAWRETQTERGERGAALGPGASPKSERSPSAKQRRQALAPNLGDGRGAWSPQRKGGMASGREPFSPVESRGGVVTAWTFGKP